LRRWAGVAAIAALLLSGCGGEPAPAPGPDVIRIGLLTALDSQFAPLGTAASQGAKVALLEAGGSLAGPGPLDTVTGARISSRPIELYIESTSGTDPGSAVAAARHLVEQRQVNVIVGPTSGDEGLAVKSYLATVPEVTLINGTSMAQNLTLRDALPNLFRFSTDGAQWMAGLGKWAAGRYHRIVTVAEDDSFPYDQVGGFLTEFCNTSGHAVLRRLWVPQGTSDFAAYISQIPKDTEAVYVALDSTDALAFIRQLDRITQRPGLPIVTGSLTLDQELVFQLGDRLEGAVSAGPVAELDTPEYDQYAAALRHYYPQAGQPGLADILYYVAMKATLTALEQAGGDMSNHQRMFRQALSQVRMDTPQGPVRLGENRQVIANNYLFQVKNGKKSMLSTVHDVDQTLNRDRTQYIIAAAFDRSNPVCAPAPNSK